LDKIAEKQLEEMNTLKKAYHNAFTSEEGIKVLRDLESATMYNKPLFSPNPYELARNEGAREVYLHIQTRMNFDLSKTKKLNETRLRDNSEE